MITKFKLFEATTEFHYRGFHCVKNPDKTPGENGLWSIPDLYWRDFGNKVDPDNLCQMGKNPRNKYLIFSVFFSKTSFSTIIFLFIYYYL